MLFNYVRRANLKLQADAPESTTSNSKSSRAFNYNINKLDEYLICFGFMNLIKCIINK